MRRRIFGWTVTLLALGALRAGAAHAQLVFGTEAAGPAIGVTAPEATPQLDADRYVVVHLAENRIYLMQDGRPVWTAPAATGTGFRLESNGRAWHFATPRGVFRVQRREKDPLWYKPDWAYAEEGRPAPPHGSPERLQKGMLGTTALYIGYELAIHGTSRPELVLHPDPEERRVSHGCIRLTNEDARTLYHLVDVGTPVLIY